MSTFWGIVTLIWLSTSLIVVFKSLLESGQEAFERDLTDKGLSWCRNEYDTEDLKRFLERYKKRVHAMKRVEQQRQMIIDILQVNANDDLTDWEEEFTETIMDWKGILPNKHFKVLLAIWEEHYSHQGTHENVDGKENETIQSWPIPSGHDPNEGKCGWHFTKGYKESMGRKIKNE